MKISLSLAGRLAFILFTVLLAETLAAQTKTASAKMPTRQETIEWLSWYGARIAEVQMENCDLHQSTGFELLKNDTLEIRVALKHGARFDIYHVALKDIVVTEAKPLQEEGVNCRYYNMEVMTNGANILYSSKDTEVGYAFANRKTGHCAFAVNNKNDGQKILNAIYHLAKMSGAEGNNILASK